MIEASISGKSARTSWIGRESINDGKEVSEWVRRGKEASPEPGQHGQNWSIPDIR